MNLKPGNFISLVTGTGADVDVSISYRDTGYPTARDGHLNTAITTATTTTVLTGPTSTGTSGCRVVESLSVRNIDSISQTLTVKHSDGTTNVAVYSATLIAGAQLYYDEAQGWSVVSGEVTGLTLITATADTANSATDTLANVAGLTMAVDAGDYYRFRAVCIYTADATTSGSRWTINGPATSAGTAYRSSYSLTTTSETVNSGLTAVQLPAAASASSAATAGNVAVVEGVYIPSTAGTFAIQFAAEAGTITAKAGSTLTIIKVINV